MLAPVLLLQAAALAGAHARRPVVSLRGDLHRWLTDRASATGEPLAAAAQDGPP
nr:hypothetical protein GCM10020093_020180 [Planobispora longispora]